MGRVGVKRAMAAFQVVHTKDPSRYREQILRLWDAYLPGTPPGRFDWMIEGNPAGPASVYVFKSSIPIDLRILSLHIISKGISDTR